MRFLKIIFLITITAACGPTAEETADKIVENAMNMCAEVQSTSIGFSGPLQRIEIMGKYGIDPVTADTFNGIIKHTHEMAVGANETGNSEWVSKQYQCQAAAGDCLGNAAVVLMALESENKATMIDVWVKSYIDTIKNC